LTPPIQIENGHRLIAFAVTPAHLDNRLSRWTKAGRQARYPACYWRRRSAVSLRDTTGTDYRLLTHLAFHAVLILP
jgi:hypothetical protein